MPFVQAAFVWIWLLGAPGWFVATRTLGLGVGRDRARRFDAIVMAAACGLALATVIHLPAILIAGHPTRIGMFATGVLASLAIVRLPSPLSLDRAVLRRAVPTPPLLFLVVLVAWMIARASRSWSVDGLDGPYLHGMVRSLADSFPPPNPAACARRIDQPWGYWMVDGMAVAGGGASVARTLGFACAVFGGIWLALAYVVVAAITGDRRAAALTLPFAVTGWEGRWIVESLAAGHRVPAYVTGGAVQMFGGTLWNAMYDVPTLILFLLVLRFAVEAEPEPAATRMRPAAVVSLLVVLAVFPLFHPASAMLADASVVAWMIFWAGRKALPRVALLLPLTGVPFVVLYVHSYAKDVAARFPFVFAQGIMQSVYVELHGANMLAYFALLLPFALLFAVWTRRARVLLAVSVAVSAAVGIYSVNIANNYHWTYDPLGVALVIAAAIGAGEALRRFPRSAAIGLAAWLALMIVAARPRELPRFLAGPPPLTADEERAADFLRTSSPPDACMLAATNDPTASRVVLAGAERRLYVEQPFHLDRTMAEEPLAALIRTNDEMTRNPGSPSFARGAVGFAFDHVVFTGAGRPSESEDAWRARSAPVFDSGQIRIYAIDHPAR